MIIKWIFARREEMQRRRRTDDDLAQHLERVQLSYLLQRDQGWDTVADWMDILSGGEKQRIAMARLFYHQPQFAILDECTSAVSVDVEGSMYQYCRDVGISLFTVSHRKSLWKHHDVSTEYYSQILYKKKPVVLKIFFTFLEWQLFYCEKNQISVIEINNIQKYQKRVSWEKLSRSVKWLDFKHFFHGLKSVIQNSNLRN